MEETRYLKERTLPSIREHCGKVPASGACLSFLASDIVIP